MADSEYKVPQGSSWGFNGKENKVSKEKFARVFAKAKDLKKKETDK